MNQLAIGLMSGTSGDGVSLALVSFSGKEFRLIDDQTYPYSKEISRQILNARGLRANEISSLDFKLGEIFASCILKFLNKISIQPSQISVIGSHGQTIFHGPKEKPPNTFQIGEPALLSEKTGITVVSDFRPQDIATGGEGAPLIPYFDQFFFGNGSIKALQNIGGIANVTLTGKNLFGTIAFDTGPGNCLIDWAAREITQGKESFDRSGWLAAKGKVSMGFVKAMIRNPYFSKEPPKSTGPELFNATAIPRKFKKMIRTAPHDFIASLTYLTATTINESYKKFLLPKHAIEEVIVSGGGALNKTLLSYLKELFAPIPVVSIEKYGMPAQAKEPAAFAFFALRAIQGKPNHILLESGREMILGKITPGKSFKGLR